MALKLLGSIVDTAKNSIFSTIKEQALDAISCENMPGNILMMRKSTPSGNISHGSSIIVEPGQMAVIVSGGAVVDATAQEGVYKFEEGAPSFLEGDFGATFKDMWTRFKFGGSRPIKDSVYFINIKEIMDNHFGTTKPVIYSDWEHSVMNRRMNTLQPMMVHVRGFGSYTFKIDDPATFLREVAGTADIYEKEELCDQMRIEVTGAVQAILNKISSEQYKIPVTQISGQAGLIKKLMEEDVYDDDIRRRGVKIVSLVISDIELTEESIEKVNQYELGGDAYSQQGVMTNAYADALVGAANNANGASTGFVGMGFANMAGGMFGNPMMGGMQQPMMNGQMQQPMMNGQMQQPMMNGQMQQPMMNGQMQQPMMNGQMQQPMMQAQAAPAGGATCQKCGAPVSGKFCAECGTQVAVPAKKFCSNCGAEVAGKFCAECGTQVQ